MPDSKDVSQIVEEIKATADEMRGNVKEYKSIKTKVDELAAQLKELVGLKAAVELLETKYGRPGAPDVPATMDGHKAFDELIRKWDFASQEAKEYGAKALKAFSIANDTAGGYFVPPEFNAQIIKQQQEMNPLLALAWKVTTGREVIQFPKETGAPAAYWIGDNTSRVDTQGTLKAGLEELKVQTLQSMIDVANTLIDDGAFNVEAYLSQKIAEYQDYAIGKAFLSGSGKNVPEGILTNSSVAAVAGGSASAISVDGMLDLYGALKTAYDRNASYIMNKKSMVGLRKLKDSNGLYYWQGALTQGMPNTFNGTPIVLATDMADIAANAYPVLYGDISKGYMVAQRAGMTVVKDPLTQRGTGMTRFYFETRIGGQVVQAEAIKKLKIATSL